MKKGRIEKIYGIKSYKKYEHKTLQERGRQRRPVVFRSKRDYDRNRMKRELERVGYG